MKNSNLFCRSGLVFLLVLALSASAVLQAASSGGSPADTLVQLHRFLQSKTFKASFKQKVYDEKRSVIDDSVGTLAIRRPGHFRWEYLVPSRQLIVADGKSLIIYDPELEQAVVQPLAARLGYAPIMLLLDATPTLEHFKVSQDGHKANLDWITLIPKVEDTEYVRIELGLSKETLVQMKMLDHFNQLTVIDFAKAEFNVELDAETFRIHLPYGTDVIGNYVLPFTR